MKRILLLSALLSFGALAQEEILTSPPPSSPAAVLASNPPPAVAPVVHTEMVDVVFGALAIVLSLAGKYLFGKSGESKVAAGLDLVRKAISAAVAEANVTLKPKLKSYLADGKIDEAEAKDLKNDVVKLVQNQLPPGLWRTVVGAFGGFAETWLKGEIEKAVIEQKKAEAEAKVISAADAAKVLGAES